MRSRTVARLACVAFPVLLALCGCAGTGGGNSNYKGWSSYCLKNDLVSVQVVPQIGGRVMQVSLGGFEYFWVNPLLAGKGPTASGLDKDGGWLNYGGSKLWPAPQGWDNDRQWPGPPDAVLDGQPYQMEELPGKRGEAAIRLTSGKDPRSGIQFSRVVRLCDGSTRVNFQAMMRNIDTKPRRWGIWAHTQLNAAKHNGGKIGDGKIFITPLEEVIRIRTGEKGPKAI